MKLIKKILLLGFIALLISPLVSRGLLAKNQIDLYFFYDRFCYNCQEEKTYLESIETKYDNITIHYLEVTGSDDNAELFDEVRQAFDQSNVLTPYLVIGGVSFVGHNEDVEKDIETMIKYYSDHDFTNVVEKVQNNESILVSDFDTVPKTTIHIPLIGEVEIGSFSLLVGAIVIGFVDGFNPCAMWVLIFLITMLINLKDRKRMWIIGFTFLFTSGLVYGLIMMSWLQIAVKMVMIVWMRILIGAFAMGFGIYNFYTFIKSLKTEDGCEVTDEPRRKKLIGRIKSIVNKRSLLLAIGGVVILAATVNLIELACSAGLPLLYTQLLAYNDLPFMSYLFYILIYLLFFLLIEIIIFVAAMITFKVSGISNRYTKYSHIIGAIIMLVLGFLLIFFPNIIMFN